MGFTFLESTVIMYVQGVLLLADQYRINFAKQPIFRFTAILMDYCKYHILFVYYCLLYLEVSIYLIEKAENLIMLFHAVSFE